ncbi:MAG: DNA-directed RNA polymerase subunit D [Acidilobaceae archaeon]|nr:DNA-directed RNA polymerase subunit D [Acidilobaceae archaeon]
MEKKRKGRVEIRELSERRLFLVVEGFPVAYMNAIRRLVLSDVPTMAVDFVYFYNNSTDVYDEMIAHRLGLTVFRSEAALEKYASPEECAEAEPPNPKCFVEMVLDFSVEEGRPGTYVKAADIITSDPEVRPVYPETPITYVAEGQAIHFVAYARLGRGKEHAKWSPATISALTYTPTVSYDSSRLSKECRECLSAYPEVLEAIDKGGSGEVMLYGRNTSGLRYCAEAVCAGAIEVKYSSKVLQYALEVTGALSPLRTVLEATRVLDNKVKRLREQLEALEVK